jgi:hypothetical protein
MKNSPLAAMCAVALSLVATIVLLGQSAIEQSPSKPVEPEQWVDEVPAPTLDPPDEIIKDLATHAWSQLESKINESLAEKDTLIVWIVDRTASMSARRLELADRIAKAFGDQPSGSQHKLQHCMISFARGGGASRRRPTTTANDVATQIREIPDDYYGDEFVMGAVNSISFRLMTGWKQAFSDWNCIAVVATDERGDDFNMAEDVATQCVKMNVRVFCLGNASPFGTEKGYVRYKYADGFQVDVPVNQGPETAMLQRLNVPVFWGTSSTHAARVSSGFGPYGLEFLCRKTGGEFLIYDDQSSQRYSKTRLRDYEPDYFGKRHFEKSLQGNRARLAICQAAAQSRPLTFRLNPVVVRGDIVAVLRAEVTAHQRECLPASQAIQKLIAILETGIDDRPTLEARRWQAAFDLALGQALAASVRLDAMNLFLAQMKVKPKDFDNAHNNTWTLQLAPEVELLSPRLKRRTWRATQLLTQVTSEHPGTPFSHVAQLELDRGFGWQWVESHREGPALTSKRKAELRRSYGWLGAPKYLERPLLKKLRPRPRPPAL